MDEFELREILLNGEDTQNQFKRQIDSQDKLAEEIVAFLNTRGGRIFVGVEEDGSIKGVTQDLDNLISNTCNDSVKPPCNVHTTNVNTSEGLVVVIEVPNGDNKPYQDKRNQFWKKRGADKRRVTERSELERLFQDGHSTYADSQPIRGASFADLNREKIARIFSQTTKGSELSDDEENAITQLEGVKLIKNGVPSRAAVLLFGKQPQNFLPDINIKAVWFKGNERSSQEYYDSRKLEGTLPEQYEKAIAFLRNWNQKIQPQGASFNHTPEDQIPEFVFEELLVNALVHRDYFVPDSVKIYIFADRIEFISPGALPNSLTPEQALQGIGRERNPLLLRYAYELMNYRGARSGLTRVKKACPDIELINFVEEEEVRIIIPIPSILHTN